jgi:arabinogalactan endo-1,4-beta-galactosidase
MFDVPDGYTMEKIYCFADNGYWNEYNTFDCGDFADGVWTGSAQHVVLTIDDGQPNTRLNSIAVIVKEPTGIITQKFATLANSWYTLQGTPLDAIPTQKGLYIHDGRVVVVK